MYSKNEILKDDSIQRKASRPYHVAVAKDANFVSTFAEEFTNIPEHGYGRFVASVFYLLLHGVLQ